jgi:hypothetical protein
MNVKINAYVEVKEITEAEAISDALVRVGNFDTINEASSGDLIVTKLYYIAPKLGKILIVVTETDRITLGVDSRILTNENIVDYPFAKLPPVISSYKELIVKKGSFLSEAQILDAGQAIVEKNSVKVLPNKIPVLKIINYNNNGVSQLVMPSIFNGNSFLSTDAVVVSSGNPDAGLDVLSSPFGVLDLNYSDPEELGWFQSGNSFLGDVFGSAVALSADGTIALVGAPGSDVAAPDGGIVYTFKRPNINTGWTLVNTYVPPTSIVGDQFGHSVALSGDGKIALVGAPGFDDASNNNGVVHTLIRDGVDAEWVGLNTYTLPVPVTDENLGRAVAISDDGLIAMVGSYNELGGNGAGSAYTLRRDRVTDAWIKVDTITLDNIPEYIYDTVIVDGETIEGNGLTDPSGTVSVVFDKVANIDEFLPSTMMHASAGGVRFKIDYSVEYDGKFFNVKIGEDTYRGTFTENENYPNPIVLFKLEFQLNKHFGTTVALSGNGLMAVVGSYGVDSTVVNSGKIYTYKRYHAEDTWTLVSVLEADKENTTDYFGMGVALNGNGTILMVGTLGDNSVLLDAGKVLTYSRLNENDSWTLINSFTALNLLAGEYFGGGIAISRYGQAVLVGALGGDNIAEHAGKVYSIRINPNI